jgi:geranylgeranyl reductase family protein
MQQLKSKITIIGAGPGGATTALFLAKAGIKTLLIDKAIFPRDKICGDALSGKVVEVLKKLDPAIILDFVQEENQIGSYGVNFIAPNLQVLHVPFGTNKDKLKNAPGFLSKRVHFDNYLIDIVKSNPLIELIENCSVNNFQKTKSGWKLISDNYEIDTELLIDASGAQSLFARHQAGIAKDDKHYCAGLRAYYKNVKGLDPENYIELHFLKEFLPGYLWIFPLPNGEANVGVGMRSDVISKKKINLKKEMLNIIKTYPALKERFIDAELVDDIKGFGLPLGSKKRKISGDNYILIGDAASLIDPFTGEGIGNAMICGMKAAETIINDSSKNRFSSNALISYDEKVYNRLWKELLLSYRMQQLVRFPWLFNFIVKKANNNKTLSETISCMFEDVDLRKKLKQPSFYFKLLFN